VRSLAYTLALILLAVASYLGARYWRASAPVELLNPGMACDLGREACLHRLPDGGEVRIDLSPRPVPLMQPVRLRVSVSNTALQPAFLEISGLNMEMGINRVPLQADGGGKWHGETIIPICSQRRMHWRAMLLLRNGVGSYRLDDEFHTARPR